MCYIVPFEKIVIAAPEGAAYCEMVATQRPFQVQKNRCFGEQRTDRTIQQDYLLLTQLRRFLL